MIKKNFFSIVKNTRFEGYNYVGPFCRLYNCEIGLMTYISSLCLFKNTIIGKYCSIASGVKIIWGEHPTKTFVSTHPIFYSNKIKIGISFLNKNVYEEYKYVNENKKTFVEIGNDVWIGTDVKILNGIKINNGAIIAAGAIVTKDVPSYTIVGGCPAKIIRKRFDDDDIKFLEELSWWNKNIQWLKEHVDLFDDINKIKKIYKNE